MNGETETQARARVAAGALKPTALRVLVCTGKHYANKVQLGSVLGGLCGQRGINTLISIGLNPLVQDFAAWAAIPLEAHTPEWALDGRKNSPMRYARILEESCPDLLVAFTGGREIEDIVAAGRAAKLKIWEIDL